MIILQNPDIRLDIGIFYGRISAGKEKRDGAQLISSYAPIYFLERKIPEYVEVFDIFG